ncbi:MAG: hypothetical protein ACFB20_05685 [Opitutales bacterium]
MAYPDGPLDAFHPLAGFFRRRQEAFPKLRQVPASDLPEHFRYLLDHDSDMTSKLESFHASAIGLLLLHQHSEAPWLEREVVLFRESDQAPVEYGAIAICLQALPEKGQEAVRAARMPFGAILRECEVEYRSHPSRFFEGEAGGSIAESLQVAAGTPTWGRCNVLSNTGSGTLARIVEILPGPVIDR